LEFVSEEGGGMGCCGKVWGCIYDGVGCGKLWNILDTIRAAFRQIFADSWLLKGYPVPKNKGRGVADVEDELDEGDGVCSVVEKEVVVMVAAVAGGCSQLPQQANFEPDC
jgi:hypothetical protein